MKTRVLGPLTLTAESVTFHGREVKLSPQERNLLITLAAHSPHVVKHSTLAALVAEGIDVEPEIIKVLICKIRRKLRKVDSAHGIVTFPGTGYSLDFDAAPDSQLPDLSKAHPDSFHAQMMAALDAATYEGGSATEAHAIMRAALRGENMAGRPIQNMGQLQAACLIYAARHAA
jgi:DNA-binding winged helix-turn-helix (wHTH) protein